MKYFLHRGLAIGQEKIDALASHAAAANRRGYSLRLLHQPAGRVRIEVGKLCRMSHRNHQHVPWIDRLNIHERGNLVVAKDEGGGQLAGQNPAKNAVLHCIRPG